MESSIEGMDHIGVVVSDLDRNIDFYTKHFGFSLIARYQPDSPHHEAIAYLGFPGGSQAKLELYVLRHPTGGEATYERKIGMREIALRVGDVEKEIERLRSEGLEVMAEPGFAEAKDLPEDSPVKRRTRGAVKAPDGVILGLYSWG